jgi:HlyD family type I secretion membrane fusion protein
MQLFDARPLPLSPASSLQNASAIKPGTNPPHWNGSLQAVLDQPPSTLPQRFLIGGLVFGCLFGTWAWFGQIQDVSRAQGRLIPQGEVYKVQPVTQGEVVKIRIKEGESVRAGQVVAELDNRIATTEVERLEQKLIATQQELRQTQDLIEKTRQDLQIREDITTAALNEQTAAIAKANGNADMHRMVIAQLHKDSAAHTARLNQLKPLVEEGALAKAQLFGVEQEIRDLERTIIQSNGELQQSLTDAQRLQEEFSRKQAEGEQSSLETQNQLQQLEIKTAQLQEKLSETRILIKDSRTRLKQLFLHAPVDGVVSSLNLRNIGEVVQPGQTIAEIAPLGSTLVLSAQLPSREAGLVKEGMPVQIKFDAFPYQHYGVMSGKVLSISSDSKVDEKLGALYRVEIQPERKYVVNHQQQIPLKGGQTASAEIVTRKRRIIEVFLDPFQQIQKGGINL